LALSLTLVFSAFYQPHPWQKWNILGTAL
jgi:ABC-type long-subunit fatty acid transport system fused permease/ATPase subunit